MVQGNDSTLQKDAELIKQPIALRVTINYSYITGAIKRQKNKRVSKMTKSELKARYAEIVTETAALEVERDVIMHGADKKGDYTYPEQDADYAENCAKLRSLTRERRQVLDAMDNE